MNDAERDGLIKNINDRTSTTEQILPTLATKEDLKVYATRDEMTAEAALTRAHFDVIAEAMNESVKVTADGHVALGAKIDTIGADIKRVLGDHERRITKLEAGQIKGR